MGRGWEKILTKKRLVLISTSNPFRMNLPSMTSSRGTRPKRKSTTAI